MSNYKQMIDSTIDGEIRARLFPLADQMKAGNHKKSVVPNKKKIDKLMKYWRRAF
jgi:hypothetical protein